MSTVNDPLNSITTEEGMLKFLNSVKTEVGFFSGRKFVKEGHAYSLQQIIDKALAIPKKTEKQPNRKIWDRIKKLDERANKKVENSLLRFIAWTWRLFNPGLSKSFTIGKQLEKSTDQKTKVADADITKAGKLFSTDLKQLHETFLDYGYDPAILKQSFDSFKRMRKVELEANEEKRKAELATKLETNSEEGVEIKPDSAVDAEVELATPSADLKLHLLDESTMRNIRQNLINRINSADIDELDKKEYIKNVNDYLIGVESSERYYLLGRQAGSEEEKIRYYFYALFEGYNDLAANEVERLLKDGDLRKKLLLSLGTEHVLNTSGPNQELFQKENSMNTVRAEIREVAEALIKEEKPHYFLLHITYKALLRLKENDEDQALIKQLKEKATSIFGA